MENKVTIWDCILDILFAVIFGSFFVASAKIQAEENKEKNNVSSEICE